MRNISTIIFRPDTCHNICGNFLISADEGLRIYLGTGITEQVLPVFTLCSIGRKLVVGKNGGQLRTSY